MKNLFDPLFWKFLWKNLGEQFPLTARIRRSFTGLAGFCLLAILVQTREHMVISVEPLTASEETQKKISSYGNNDLLLTGNLVIRQPDFFQRLFIKETQQQTTLFTLISIMIASIVIVWIVPKLGRQHLFRKDVSRSIQILGYMIILHGIVSLYANIKITEQVEIITGQQYTTPYKSFPVMLFAQLYIGLVVIALGAWYKRGLQLQKEHDLTI